MASSPPAASFSGDPEPSEIKRRIAERARGLGFDVVGFARAETDERDKHGLTGFLQRGYHGDMAWMAETASRRADPRVLWPDARSIIALGLNYGPAEDPMKAVANPGCGAISVYAQARDYHDVIKKKLKRLAREIAHDYGAEVKVFVDTAPVMEKPFAERAGLGWQGKHTNLVSRSLGSWLFLGEIFTALELPPDTPESDHCGQCRRCLDVCPTDAFPAPYQLDARRCISYLTIEHKGHIAPELRTAIGNRIFGCDDCLAVCPWNKFAQQTREMAFRPRAELTAPRLADLAVLTDEAFRALFSGSPIKRVGRARFVRNVLIALGNTGERGLAAVAERLMSDESPLVRAMAVWALSRLSAPEHFAALRTQHLGAEGDPAVRAEWALGDADRKA